MEYNFGGKIKSLRKAREMTQEQLAEVLGVSYQAVSKWETNLAYPDVTLFPILARFFGVTTDELHGMSELRDKERIDAVQAQIIDKLLNGDADGTLALKRELAREFPNDDEVQISLVTQIMYLPDDKKKNNLEALAILERLARSENADTRCFAQTQLPRAYANAGFRDKAVELAKALPSLLQARENALIYCNRDEDNYLPPTEENEKLLRDTLKSAAQLVMLLSEYMRQMKGVTDEELADSVYGQLTAHAMEMHQLSTVNEFETDPVMTGMRMLSESAAQVVARDPKSAMEMLEQTVAALHTQFAQLKEAGIPLESFVDPARLVALFDKTEFDPIRNHPRFAAVIERLNTMQP
ncbi:MAG: helix-turn-helix domain-containing protein [Oscillospiraceae bacterium]|jgi:transcriptional regulator with XRE-family HTH domain|nr:helix-turn-helix domain-containing protein [Oscillospiraceae bacterium]